MPDKKPASLESVERIICYFAENGGFNFTLYYVGHPERLKAKIDETWNIHSVVLDDKKLSIVASHENQKPVEYSIRSPESLKKIKKWLEDTAKKIKPAKRRGGIPGVTVPPTIVFALRVKENF